MSPIISLRTQITRHKAYLETLTPNTYPHDIAIIHLRNLNKQLSRHSSLAPVTQSMAAPLPVPIRCGIRTISATPQMSKDEPWVWDRLTDAQARALEKTQTQIRELFFTTAERHILRLIILSGGLKASMKNLGFEGLTVLPEFLRQSQGAALFKTFTDKLLK